MVFDGENMKKFQHILKIILHRGIVGVKEHPKEIKVSIE